VNPNGKAAVSRAKLEGSPTQVLPSPDGSSAIVESRGRTGITLEFLDTKAGRILAPPVREASACWWQSDSQVGYLDAGGKRHILGLH
jgi:hypothetical protein